MNYSRNCYETDQSRNPNNLTSTYSGYSTHEEAANETYHVRPPPMEIVASVPSCCMSQNLPIYRRLEDPTITPAPNVTISVSNDNTQRRGYQKDFPTRGEVNLPIGGHKSFPGVAIPMPTRNVSAQQAGQQMPINVRMPRQNIPVSQGTSSTARNPRGLINRTTTTTRSPFNATKNVIKAVQYLNRHKDEPVNRPLGFDPYINDQNYQGVNRPIGFEQYLRTPNNVTITRPLGFEEYMIGQNYSASNRPLGFQHMENQIDQTSGRPIGFEQYMQSSVGGNVTYDQPPVYLTSSQPFSSDNVTFDQSVNYTDRGPWRNFEIPKNLRKVNVTSSTNKTYPQTIVPPPSRNYSTYDDRHQTILNVKEVAMHRKKAPRFYSTPTEADFSNKGTEISSVWGQDLDSMRPDQTSSYVDSSVGWSQGVRMDSFNVITSVTPEPKNIKVPPRLNKSYMPAAAKKRTPAPDKTHTYIQNPYAILNLSSMQRRAQPVERSRIRGRTYEMSDDANINSNREALSSSNMANRTHEVSKAQNETYCAPCGNTTFSVENTEPEASDKTITVLKKSEEGKAEPGKDFCTVLEIRTPCGNNPSQPDKPLNLSINVTCADPSLLVTPDKRYNVISHTSAPQVSQAVSDVPSDCACG